MKCPQPYHEYDYDKDLSFKDFTTWEFINNKTYDLNGKVIYGSTFSKETPDSKIFPDNLKGTLFIKCNLDNIILPKGIPDPIDCSQWRCALQNDRQFWFVDEDNNPIQPTAHKIYKKLGLEIPKPEDIPEEMIKVEDIPNLIELAKK